VTPAPGVKVSSVVALSNDIALAMKAYGIRVIAPIPGKAAIGLEIPNAKAAPVYLREILETALFAENKKPLTFVLGRYGEGAPAVADLEKMPHLLVAGATNSGKSIFLHAFILSLIFRNTPDTVKFLMIDPKRLELTFYDKIPYLYDPRVTCDKAAVITQSKDASRSLVALTKVMEQRYAKFEKARVKDISSYNRFAREHGEDEEFYIIVVIDELADLILQAKDIVEDSIQRLAQMALLGEHGREVVVRVGAFGVELDGLLELLDGLIEPPAIGELDSTLVVEVRLREAIELLLVGHEVFLSKPGASGRGSLRMRRGRGADGPAAAAARPRHRCAR